MILKIGVLGASGKMGLEVASLLAEGHEVHGDRMELADAVASSGKISYIEGVEVRKLEDPEREPVHAWVDFSRPEATVKLLDRISVPIVIATTGFTEGQSKKIRDYSLRHAVLLAPNTSPGISLMQRMLRQIPAGTFDVILEEEHHKTKKDSPSGTAKALLETLADNGYTDVQVHVTRAGNIVGNHIVKLVANDEEIIIEHRARNRSLFAHGALIAARFIARVKKPGLYSMDDIFSGRNSAGETSH